MGSSIAGNGGIIGASNVPTAASPAAKVTTITSNGCFNRAVASATVIVVDPLVAEKVTSPADVVFLIGVTSLKV